jgi:hypothetical protein
MFAPIVPPVICRDIDAAQRDGRNPAARVIGVRSEARVLGGEGASGAAERQGQAARRHGDHIAIALVQYANVEQRGRGLYCRIALILEIRRALPGSLECHDLIGEPADRAERFVQRIDIRDDAVLRRLALLGVNSADPVHRARERRGGLDHLGLLGLARGIDRECRERIL